jgi:histidyl-tRNA synthetase
MNLIETKPPKGTIDLYGDEYEKISYYKSQLEKIFIQNGGIGLETPVFDHKSNLMDKYGEEAETKLVFNLEQTGNDDSEKYTLKYDLTIPKMRFVKSKSIDKARIYSINKVYRRDTPSLGRFREFYQADFDIIGEDSTSLINECILLKMAHQFIQTNNLGGYKILINDTSNLFYMLIDLVGIDVNNFKSICSTIDKLDKYPFDKLETEFKLKGLSDNQIQLLKTHLLNTIPINPEILEKINKIKSMAKHFEFDSNIVFTPHMARGLDYYNGIIFEIVLDNFNSTIISGGRYDGLIDNTSLIGISFGLSRMLELLNNSNITKWKSIYMISCISSSIDLNTKLSICSKLEKKFGFPIQINSDIKEKKLIKTINWCIQNYIKYLFIIGPDELKLNKVILKDLEKSSQELIELD